MKLSVFIEEILLGPSIRWRKTVRVSTTSQTRRNNIRIKREREGERRKDGECRNLLGLGCGRDNATATSASGDTLTLRSNVPGLRDSSNHTGAPSGCFNIRESTHVQRRSANPNNWRKFFDVIIFLKILIPNAFSQKNKKKTKRINKNQRFLKLRIHSNIFPGK